MPSTCRPSGGVQWRGLRLSPDPHLLESSSRLAIEGKPSLALVGLLHFSAPKAADPAVALLTYLGKSFSSSTGRSRFFDRHAEALLPKPKVFRFTLSYPALGACQDSRWPVA